MYFPENMNFQYFFFATYIGYFLEALPFALIVGIIYGIIRFMKDQESPLGRKIFSCVFVCYITGLICLVIGLDLMRIFWYSLFYHRYSGITIYWFSGSFNIVPNFFNNLNGETIGNFLMLSPSFPPLHTVHETFASYGVPSYPNRFISYFPVIVWYP